VRRGGGRRDLLLPHGIAFQEAFRAANGGEGIACLHGNYSGDNMNVKMAEDGKARGIRSRPSSPRRRSLAPRDHRESGAASRRDPDVEVRRREGRQGATLNEVIETAQKAIDLPVRRHWPHALPLPAVGPPNLEIKGRTMEVASATCEPGIEVPAGNRREMPSAGGRRSARLPT
jgi:dihydroxyacetone kinase-like protein